MSNKNTNKTPELNDVVEVLIRYIRSFQAAITIDSTTEKQIDDTIYLYRDLYQKEKNKTLEKEEKN